VSQHLIDSKIWLDEGERVQRLGQKLRRILLFIAFTGWWSGLARAQTLLTLDASGAAGLDGSIERDYSTSPGASSGRGRSGNSASPSTPGQPGGLIDILMRDLSPVGQRATISISGIVGKTNRSQNLEYSPTDQYIFLDARGGRGGHGGRGGDGEGGCNGRDGSNATRSSRGGNGTNGCDGGDGGLGTPGSPGGPGGTVRVHLDQNDTHLIMLVRADVSGGSGSNPGKNGKGGRGGSGGDGGSGLSWTTPRVTGRKCDSDYTVNNSNGSRTVKKGACHDVTTTDTHSMSGGFDGSDGRDGVTRNNPVPGGSQGPNGKFEVIVHNENGSTETFARSYDLELISFTMLDENLDGIFEFGERVLISGIKVKNVGQMPTPAGKSDVLVLLGSSAWAVADPVMLKVPQLKAGVEYTLPDQLSFVIKDSGLVGTDKRVVVEDRITPIAKVTRVEKTFDGFRLPKTLTVTYPVEITPIDVRPSIGPGERARIVWRVKNLSQKALGANSELNRILSTGLNLEGGDGRRDQISYLTPTDQKIWNLRDGFIRAIGRIPPGGEILIEGEIAIGPEALPYTSFELSSGLNLQAYGDSAPRKIQKNSLSIRVAQVYSHDPESSLLLLADRDSNREEILAWKKLAEKIGLKMNIWDVSYYGFFSLTRMLEKQGDTIENMYAHKTIIVPAGSSQNLRTENPLAFLSRTEFLRAAVRTKLNMLVLGGELGTETKLTASLLRPDEPRLTNVSSIEEALKASEKYGSFEETELPGSGYSISVMSTQFSKPVPEELIRRAEKFLAQMKKDNPSLGFRLESSFNGAISKTGTLRDTYHLGNLEVIPVHRRNSGRLVVLSVPIQELRSANYILSQENLRAVLLGLDLREKMKAFSKALGSGDSLLEKATRDALIYEVAFQLQTVAHESEGSEATKKGETLFSEILESSIMAGPFSGNPARVHELIASIDSFTSRVLEGPSRALVQDKWESQIRKTLLNARGISGSADGKFAEEEIKKAIQILEEKAQSRKRILPGISKADNYRHLLLWPALHRTQGTDRDLYDSQTIFKKGVKQ
jgi:hypothetical protein